MTYREALAWLYGTQRFGIKLGLENVRRLLGELKVSGKEQRIIHVAGTNGKGSVCAMVDAVCRADGKRSGLFISPHLVTYRERIRVNGEMISPEDVAQGLSSIRELIRAWDPHPTFFEITTALALAYFKKQACEIIVLETGNGGRLDATNATTPVVSVITPIGYDHEKWLGDTLEKIASEKAGIIKPLVPVVCAEQDPAAEQVIRRRATECRAPLNIIAEPYLASTVGLAGKHQQQNAALAVASLRAAGIAISDAAIKRGLAAVEWPARFQSWDERIIIDGAHNPAGARVLAETWRQQFANERAAVLLGVLKDKDIASLWRALAPLAARVILPRFRSERAFPQDELATLISSITPSLPCSITPSFSDALESARATSDRILITGSLHFAGEALATLQGNPDALEDCAQ